MQTHSASQITRVNYGKTVLSSCFAVRLSCAILPSMRFQCFFKFKKLTVTNLISFLRLQIDVLKIVGMAFKRLATGQSKNIFSVKV